MSQLICFWDKSKIQVNDDIGEKIKQAILTDSIKGFMIAGNFYAVGGVEKIISKADAYDIFPAEFETLKAMEDKSATLPALSNGQKLLN